MRIDRQMRLKIGGVILLTLRGTVLRTGVEKGGVARDARGINIPQGATESV